MYLSLFTLQDLAMLNDWLNEHGELYVDVYHPHSGSGGTPYHIRSIRELRALVAQQQWPELGLTIFRQRQYPLRGIVDTTFIEQAVQYIAPDTWYAVVALDDVYPAPCTFYGSGKTHAELRQDLEDLRGVMVGVGINPFDVPYDTWFRDRPDDVFLLHVAKSRNAYREQVLPSQYQQWLLQLWQTSEEHS